MIVIDWLLKYPIFSAFQLAALMLPLLIDSVFDPVLQDP
jgi:hypothetical protein